MIAALITTMVLGGTVMLASQMQRAYTTQLDDVVVEEEARFSLDWIEQVLRNAGSNPYSITVSGCAAANFTPITIIGTSSIRVQSDSNPPNGLLGGLAGACNEEGEDITIAHDVAALVITRRDHNLDAAAVAMTEPVVIDLDFTYFDSNRNVTANPNLVSYVGVRVIGKSVPNQRLNAANANFNTRTLETEVHIRTR